jgi:predicted acetyltransferase
MMSGVPPSDLELVNPVAREEIPAWLRAMLTTFLSDPSSASAGVVALGRRWDPERAWGARERGQWVATLRTEPRMLTVPGTPGDVPEVRVDALTNVTVAATHRRRGLMTDMLAGSLQAAKERGDALSILIAAEWPIYGRFGYAPGTLSAGYTFRRSRPGAAPPGDPSRVRQVDRDDFAEAAPQVFAASRRERAGHVDRDGEWWPRVLGRDGYAGAEDLPHHWFLHEGEDGPDGLLAWKGESLPSLIPPLGNAEVWLLANASAAAYRDLWAYLSGLDMVEEIRLANRPVDEPIRWLLPDARTLVATEIVDFVWVRVLDIPAALSARGYVIPGDVVLEVVDDAGPDFTSGHYRLLAEGVAATCEPTRREPDVAITQRALASIYLGGFRLRELAITGAVRELTPGALGRVDAMFSTSPAPWNATWF